MAILALALLTLGTIPAVPRVTSEPRVLGSLATRVAIHIVGDANFTAANGVVGGQGTPADPYVIAGWGITAQAYPGIWIQDTRAYFVVRDAAVRCSSSYGSGMSYENVTDGRLRNVSVRQCYVSLDMARTSRMGITASNFTGPADAGDGLHVTESDNLTIEGVNLTAAWASLSFGGGQNLTLRQNHLAGDLNIWSSRDVLIESNGLTRSSYIRAYGVSQVQFLDNNLTLGGIFAGGDDHLEMSRNRVGPLGVSLDCTWGRCDTFVVTADNLVGGKPLLFYRGVSDVTVDDAPVGEVIFVNSTRTRVSNLTFDRGGPTVVVADGNGLELVNVSVEASGAGVVSLSGVRNATVSNMRSIGFDLSGVRNAAVTGVANGSWLSVSSSSNLSVQGSVFSEVGVVSSSNVTLRSNEVTASYAGIAISRSTNVLLQGNNLSGQQSALYVDATTYLGLSRNRIGSGGAFLCSEASLCETYNVTADNLVNDRPLLFYRDRSDLVVDGTEVGELFLVNCTGVRLANLTFPAGLPSAYSWDRPPAVIALKVEGLQVANLTAQDSAFGGVILRDVQNASVSGVQGISWLYGLQSRHLTLENNSLSYSYAHVGFEGVQDVTVSSNTATAPNLDSYGYFRLDLLHGANLTVMSNRLPLGLQTSLYFDDASNVTVEANAFASVSVGLDSGGHARLANNTMQSGGYLWMYRFDDVILAHNGPALSAYVQDSRGGVAVGNDWRGGGLQLYNTTGWTLYNNSFSYAAWDDRGFENHWDNGYPTGGNLWMDYKGVDKCRGPSQDDCTAGDGIGDTPYVIDDNSTDRYPFMPPPIPPPPSPANNLPPVALITAYPTTAVVGQDITFVGTDSYDPDGQKDLLVYRWDFGDGTNSTQEVAIHAYSVVGHYTVTLTVWDLYNAKGTASVNVTVVVSQPPTSVQLLPFQLWDGYRLPLPIGWSFRLNATVGNRTYDIFLDGLYNDTPVTLAADSEVEAGIQETPSTLQAFAQKVLSAARSTDPDARFLADPEARTLSNHAGVVFTVVYPRLSVFQEFGYVVSAASSRSWIIFMSGSLHDREYLAAVFERILAGFAITLIGVKPPDLTPLFLAMGGSAAVLAPVAYLAYSQRKRPRRGTRRK